MALTYHCVLPCFEFHTEINNTIRAKPESSWKLLNSELSIRETDCCAEGGSVAWTEAVWMLSGHLWDKLSMALARPTWLFTGTCSLHQLNSSLASQASPHTLSSSAHNWGPALTFTPSKMDTTALFANPITRRGFQFNPCSGSSIKRHVQLLNPSGGGCGLPVSYQKWSAPSLDL